MAVCSPHKAFCLNLQTHTGKQLQKEEVRAASWAFQLRAAS